MTQRLNILIVSSEVEPFSKTGGLADVAGALPKALKALKHDVRVITPKYRGVEKKAGPLETALPNLSVPIAERRIEGALRLGKTADTIPVYFLEQDHYYTRDALYTTAQGDYQDNCERFIFFCRATIEALRAIGWRPHVIHANDWQAGLIPVYLRTLYRDDPFFSSTTTLFTIHNLAYQGLFWHYDMPMTGLGWDLFTPAGIEFYGKINFLKGGLVFSDLLNTVSNTYAKEIQTEEFGCGLEGVLRERSEDLYGVVNGIDYEAWDPSTDLEIPKRYAADSLDGKAECKSALKEKMKLDRTPAPLIGMVTRIAQQKGLDLVLSALPGIVEAGAQLVLLGTGEPEMEQAFREAAQRYAGRVAVKIGYEATLARWIYAGADMFLMPSRYEPCGLGQLISLRYGTVPVVRWTGGLSDTVSEFDPAKRRGTGFGFSAYDHEALLSALRKALTAYRDPAAWQQLLKRGMAADFSWEQSAREYVALYRKAIQQASRKGSVKRRKNLTRR